MFHSHPSDVFLSFGISSQNRKGFFFFFFFLIFNFNILFWHRQAKSIDWTVVDFVL